MKLTYSSWCYPTSTAISNGFLLIMCTLYLLFWTTYRPLDGQGCHSHWMCGGGTPWDVQWRACLLPRGTEPGSCNDTAFSPIWGLTIRQQTHTNRAMFNHWGKSKTELKVGGDFKPSFLTIDHKCEREILVESMFLDSYQDSVRSSILLCYIPDYQGIPIHVISGALLCCHLAIL